MEECKHDRYAGMQDNRSTYRGYSITVHQTCRHGSERFVAYFGVNLNEQFGHRCYARTPQLAALYTHAWIDRIERGELGKWAKQHYEGRTDTADVATAQAGSGRLLTNTS
jgi:hypothetical protein